MSTNLSSRQVSRQAAAHPPLPAARVALVQPSPLAVGPSRRRRCRRQRRPRGFDLSSGPLPRARRRRRRGEALITDGLSPPPPASPRESAAGSAPPAVPSDGGQGADESPGTAGRGTGVTESNGGRSRAVWWRRSAGDNTNCLAGREVARGRQ